MKLKICERWTIDVGEPGEKWFLDYVLRAQRDASIHLTAGWHAYQSVLPYVGEVDTAIEYFGGLGAQSMMIEEMFDPRLLHVVYDFSTEAAEHLKSLDLPVHARQADSYDPENFQPADLVGLDFGDLTVWKTREGEPHRKLMDRVFAARPQAVVLTDVACRYLHLHRERYETILGEGSCVSYESYLSALALRIEELYGYTMVGGFWHRWSTVMALVPGQAARGRFVPTPESPVGLEVLP